jgi:NAD(P)-dependent dehydrogenase (short-subunit alcohol dehydrogenase family)
VASGAHRRGRLDFDDLQSRRGFRGFTAYSTSKLCNILFTRELVRHAPAGVTANCLHPGFVATRFGDESGGWMRRVVGLAKNILAISPEEGARTIIYLASSPKVEGVTGEYFYKCRVETPTSEARNDADARRLWDISEKIAGLPREGLDA